MVAINKVVTLFSPDADLKRIDNELTSHSLVKYRSVKIAEDYEQQVGQEIFLTKDERRTALIGALLGALAGLDLVAWLLGNNELGQLISPLLANTIYSALFTATGVGLAAGGLLAGLYALSRPLPKDFTGFIMLILYCKPREEKKAMKILKENGGIII
ncbi:hypothetical protein JCM14036_12250 [Desulfotomaculum defluvii]